MTVKIIASAVVMLILVSCAGKPTPPVEVTSQITIIQPADQGTTTPLPEFIYSVWPRPGATVSLKDYDNSLPVPREWGIEVVIVANKVDDEPDMKSPHNIVARTQLLVNGQTVDNNIITIQGGLQDAYAEDQDGQLIPLYQIGPTYLNWPTPLDIGEHEIRVQIQPESPSGEILEFVWFITITD